MLQRIRYRPTARRPGRRSLLPIAKKAKAIKNAEFNLAGRTRTEQKLRADLQEKDKLWALDIAKIKALEVEIRRWGRH